MNAAVARRVAPWMLGLALAVVLAACGGGSGDAPAPSRIEAGPQGVLLTRVGDSRTLSGQPLDAAGTPMAGPVSWSSSDPAVVSVDSSGTIRALVATGSARVTASSGTLQSNAVLVTIAQPVAGAQLLADHQIVAGPTAVDPSAVPAAGNAYEVVLRGVLPLAVGVIVLASESASVAGRVLSVLPEGTDQRVRLAVVPPNQLFSAFDFDDSVDLRQGPLEIPAELTALYDVAQTGNTFVFTPKPGAFSALTGAAAAAAGSHRKTIAATASRPLPPLPPFRECSADIAFAEGLPVPLALSAPPTFEFTIDGTVRRLANAQGTRIIVAGSPTFKVNSVLEIKSAFEAKIGCTLTLARRTFRAPGWAGLFFGGDVELAVGFEVGGKVTLLSAKVGGTAALNTTVSATLDCPAVGSCTLDGRSTAQTALTPVLQAPALEQAQFEPSVNLFGLISLEAGNADVQQLQFKAIEIKAGAELAGSLAPEALQIANPDPDTGRSKYALAFKGEVGPGIELGEFLGLLGLGNAVPLKLAFALDLGTSPGALSVAADRARYLPGERATVTVKLVPATTLFPSGRFYNVDRVVLRRKTGLITTEVLAEQAATAGQTDFTLAFDSTALLNAGEIVAFVVTKALPLDPPMLELAAAQGPNVVTIETANLPRAGVGRVYSAILAAQGGTTPYTWVATGLPVGLGLDASSGEISGTAVSAGSATVVVTVTAADGSTARRTLSLVAEVGITDVAGTYTGELTRFVEERNTGRIETMTLTIRQAGATVTGEYEGTALDGQSHAGQFSGRIIDDQLHVDAVWASTDPSCPGTFANNGSANGFLFGSFGAPGFVYTVNVLEQDCHPGLRKQLRGVLVRN